MLIFCFSVYFKTVDNYKIFNNKKDYTNDIKKINSKYKQQNITNHFKDVFENISNIYLFHSKKTYLIKKENFGVVMIFIMPIIAYFSYNFVGKPSYKDTSIIEIQQNGGAVANNLSDADMKIFISSMVNRLRMRLENDPQQDEGLWLKLSNSYLKLGDFENLKWSSKQWYDNFKNPTALILYIRTLRFLNNNKNNKEIVKYMKELYKIQPNNTENSILLGVWEYKNNNKKLGKKIIDESLNKLKPSDKKQIEQTLKNLLNK